MNSSRTIFTVSELTHQIKLILEETFPTIWVQGEVSNFKDHYSGHWYFTLKDDNSQISCVMWKSRTFSVPFQLEDGLKVHVFGNIRLYEKSGRYQVDSIMIQQAGIGDLQIEFEKLKRKLFDEGLFNDQFKKDLPKYPEKIGIITSPTGAAIKDIISVIQRRFPSCQLIVKGVKVQGQGASEEITDAINNLNQFSDIDLIILGRGGGSLEDLWAFNEENVARAIFESNIPIISAVGHDIDFTISDFVADLRAPTPSAAAELAVPDSNEIQLKISELKKTLFNIFNLYIENSTNKINNIVKNYAFQKTEDIIYQFYQQLDDYVQRMSFITKNNMTSQSKNLENLKQRLISLHPDEVLKRGYSIVKKDDQIVKSIQDIKINDTINTIMFDGVFTSKVSEKKNVKKSNV